MAQYSSPIRDIDFVLNEVIRIDELTQFDRFADATPDIIRGVIEEAGRQIDETIGVLNALGDTQGCRLEGGQVTTPDGFKQAYASYVESGWLGLDKELEHDGQALPYTLATAVTEILSGANASFSLYPGLSNGAYEALLEIGTQSQQDRYMTHLCHGDWSGTMCLTEPNAGSDLGQVRTKAIPQDDGSYRIEGTKIFITAGEHDMTDNIIHLVLARLPDAPDGIRGISMFIVPKVLINEDGSLGERNALECASLEEKMGIHGSSTCVMNFNNATAELLGREHHGIQNMFVMMNHARLLVGLQGLGVAERATQNAIAYAKDRKQGRALARKAESTFDSEPIIVHPDVRRMLFTMKALTEGGRMLAYDAAKWVDLSKVETDPERQKYARDRVDLLTPICKAFLTDSGFEVSSLGIQVYGGHGYIRENGMEQNLRDSKIFCIYEGTNGIQAMDLVGRKLMMNDGALPEAFFKEIADLIQSMQKPSNPVEALTAMMEALAALHETTEWMQQANVEQPDHAAACACDYLQMFGLVTLGYYWLRALQEAAKDDTEFYRGKCATAEFFMDKLLPRVHGLARVIQTGGESVADVDESLI